METLPKPLMQIKTTILKDTPIKMKKHQETSKDPPTTFTMNKHKENFRALHGTFSDKSSQDIRRWMHHAQQYMDDYNIPSLEMASIVIHSLHGKPLSMVRRMLQVPGTSHRHSDHFCEQPLQPAVAYSPYIPQVEAEDEICQQFEKIRDGVVVITRKATKAVKFKRAQPAVLPVRFEPMVEQGECLKHYLISQK